MTDLKRKFMQHHDGELDAISDEQLERRLTWDSEGRRYLDELQMLGEGVRGAMQQSTANIDLTDSIMTRIEQEQRQVLPSLWSRRIGMLSVGLGSTAALAAAVLLWFGGVQEQAPLPVAQQIQSPRAVAAVAPAQTDPGAAIESVDFGMGGGSIFMVQAGQDTTPVVWLTEAQEVPRGEPL